MASSSTLILASTSESRRALVDSLGISYRVEAPHFDETHPEGVAPHDLAEALALGKARSVSRKFEDELTLGADQLLVLEGKLLHKPKDASEAREQLDRLNGKSHLIVTGIAILCEKTHALRVTHETTRLTLHHHAPGVLDKYVASGEWTGSVGAYRIEGQGIKLFERIEGDFTNVRGLPLVRLCGALRELGVPLF